MRCLLLENVHSRLVGVMGVLDVRVRNKDGYVMVEYVLDG